MTIAEHYLRARVNGKKLGNELSPLDLNEAYLIQSVNRKHFGGVAAWKLGGTTDHTRKLFATSSVYYGSLLYNQTFSASENITLPYESEVPVGELEVSFRLSKEVERLSELELNDNNIHQYIESVMPSIELPWTPFPLPESGLNVLVADFCAAGALIIGEEKNWDRESIGLLTGAVTIRDTQSILAKGGGERIINGPLYALEEFLRLAKLHGLALKEGQIVATGGCTPCVPLTRGKALTVSFEKLGTFKFGLGK